MQLFYFSIGLTVLSNLLYHIFQKATSNAVNPIISLIITYSTALILSLIILPIYSAKNNLEISFKGLNWASFALAIAIIGLEVGFLLAYRAGWNISLAAVASNVAVTILLVPAGLLLFKESITLLNSLGIIFCIIGIILVNLK